LRIVALASGAIDKAGAIVYEHSVRPAEKVYAPWPARCRTQLDAALAALEAETDPARYYLGDRPMQPDITTACLIGYLKHRMPDAFPQGPYPKISKAHASFAMLAAWRETEPASDEVMPARPAS